MNRGWIPRVRVRVMCVCVCGVWRGNDRNTRLMFANGLLTLLLSTVLSLYFSSFFQFFPFFPFFVSFFILLLPRERPQDASVGGRGGGGRLSTCEGGGE